MEIVATSNLLMLKLMQIFLIRHFQSISFWVFEKQSKFFKALNCGYLNLIRAECRITWTPYWERFQQHYRRAPYLEVGTLSATLWPGAILGTVSATLPPGAILGKLQRNRILNENQKQKKKQKNKVGYAILHLIAAT